MLSYDMLEFLLILKLENIKYNMDGVVAEYIGIFSWNYFYCSYNIQEIHDK